MTKNNQKFIITWQLPELIWLRAARFAEKKGIAIVIIGLSLVSIISFIYYYHNQLGLAYNDARSHLDIGRRVVEGLNPGMAQLGSVWLPLTHFLMILSVWNNFMWHSGLAGAVWSMLAFVGTGALVYKFLQEINVGLLGRFTGVIILAANINILYLQSTAMTELMLLFTMTAGVYYFMLWLKNDKIYYLVLSGLWIMLSSLVRYDGWFLFVVVAAMIFFWIWRRDNYHTAEGMVIMFAALAGFGIFLWLLWNLLIFRDVFYFIFGPFSAHSQQLGLEQAGVLATKHNLLLSVKIYLYALAYNSDAFIMLLGFLGMFALWFNKNIKPAIRFSTFALLAPFFFNIIALYLGHSVLYIAGLSGETWFNVRYGIMMMPSFAIFIGYLIHRAQQARPVLIGLILFVLFFSFISADAVTIDDALIGSSQKDVTEVSGWLRENTADRDGFILISVASHDAIIFSSGLPMKKFIHEGAGIYYDNAKKDLGNWARWIVVRTYSDTDSTWSIIKDKQEFYDNYILVDHYPFADIYELKEEYVPELITEPIYSK